METPLDSPHFLIYFYVRLNRHSECIDCSRCSPRKFLQHPPPLAPVSRLLTHNLTPDPITGKDPSSFLKVVQETPSIQRRARLLDPASHFSYVTPLPLAFPFQIEFPEEIEDKKEFIEV
jgi:hypothetical protein